MASHRRRGGASCCSLQRRTSAAAALKRSNSWSKPRSAERACSTSANTAKSAEQHDYSQASAANRHGLGQQRRFAEGHSGDCTGGGFAHRAHCSPAIGGASRAAAEDVTCRCCRLKLLPPAGLARCCCCCCGCNKQYCTVLDDRSRPAQPRRLGCKVALIAASALSLQPLEFGAATARSTCSGASKATSRA